MNLSRLRRAQKYELASMLKQTNDSAALFETLGGNRVEREGAKRTHPTRSISTGIYFHSTSVEIHERIRNNSVFATYK